MKTSVAVSSHSYFSLIHAQCDYPAIALKADFLCGNTTGEVVIGFQPKSAVFTVNKMTNAMPSFHRIRVLKKKL